MSDLTIRTWMDQEKNSFDNFKEPIATRFEGAICRATLEYLRRAMKKTGEASIQLPWGTHRVTTKVKGDTGNITPSWEPSKGFLKALNGDFDGESVADCIMQDEFDPQFFKLFRDYVAYGFFDPDAPENKDRTNINKGVKLSDDEAVYFLNSWAQVLITIAKDKQRDGKVFRLEVNAEFPFGIFSFEYDDDEIKPTFVYDKVAKQILKDDDAASAAADADFSEITDTRRIDVPVKGDTDD